MCNKEYSPLKAWEEVKTYIEDLLYDKRDSQAFCYTSTSQYLTPFIKQVEADLKESIKAKQELEDLKSAISQGTMQLAWNNMNSKEHKALEIIKEKKLDIREFKCYKTLTKYNQNVSPLKWLTQEEFDLLKEILSNEK